MCTVNHGNTSHRVGYSDLPKTGFRIQLKFAMKEDSMLIIILVQLFGMTLKDLLNFSEI